jgi:HIT domain-containing protein
MDCELCNAEKALFGDDNAFVRYDNNSLSKGHVLVVPRRHVADFFEMTWAGKNVNYCFAGSGEGAHFTRTLTGRLQRRCQYREGGWSITCTSTYT